MKIKKPKFNKIKFKTKSEFSKFLANPDIAPIQIFLDDERKEGMEKIWIHRTGEIIHTDFNWDMYRGKFISMVSLEVGNCIWINRKRYKNLKISKIIITGRISETPKGQYNEKQQTTI